jgi:hypothetical protein
MLNYSCDECSRLFASRDPLLQHLQDTGHKLTVYSCKICDEAFSVFDKKSSLPFNRLEQHQRSTGHTGIQIRETSLLNLTNKLPLPPPESVKKLGNADPPKNTKVTASEKIPDPPNEKEFSCEECSRSFVSTDPLLQHLQATDHKVSVYYCNSCNDPFSIFDQKPILPLTRLQQHQNSTGHTGIRKLKTSVARNDGSEDDDDDYEWECGECQKAFNTKKALGDHQIATGHRDPTCSICKRAFGSEKALEQHVSATGHGETYEPPSSPSKPIQSNQQLLPAGARSASEASVKVVVYQFSFNSFPVVTVISFLVSRIIRSFSLILGEPITVLIKRSRKLPTDLQKSREARGPLNVF